jgi:hypothetical protein
MTKSITERARDACYAFYDQYPDLHTGSIDAALRTAILEQFGDLDEDGPEIKGLKSAPSLLERLTKIATSEGMEVGEYIMDILEAEVQSAEWERSEEGMQTLREACAQPATRVLLPDGTSIPIPPPLDAPASD